jgi:hypothetical protein
VPQRREIIDIFSEREKGQMNQTGEDIDEYSIPEEATDWRENVYIFREEIQDKRSAAAVVFIYMKKNK